MSMKIGNKTFGKVYIGNKEVSDMYRGASRMFQNIQYAYFFGDFSSFENVQLSSTCTETGFLTCDASTFDEVNSPVEIECQCLFSAFTSYSSVSSATAISESCDTGAIIREVQTRTRTCTGGTSVNTCVANSCCTGSPNQCVSNSCCTTSSFSCNCTTTSFSCNCTTSSVCTGGSFGAFGPFSDYVFSTAGTTTFSCGCSTCGQTGVQGECIDLFGGPVCRRRTRTCNCSFSNQTTCQTCSSTSCQTCTQCNANSCCTTTNTCQSNSCCTGSPSTNTCSCGTYGSFTNTSSCSNEFHECGQIRECQQRTRTGQNQQRSRTCQRMVV